MDTEEPVGATASPWAVAHARGLGARRVGAGRVEVELLTDPWSVWCWGFEPVRRAIEHRFPSITFTSRVGGMFERLPDPREAGFDVERFFAVVQRTTGMPIRPDAARRDRPESTYPACVHAIAVRLLAPDLESRYVRRLREAAYLDGLNVSSPDVAADVAAALGLDRREFVDALRSGEPEREFRAGLDALHVEKMHAYPTLTVRTEARAARVEGFQSLPALMSIVESVSARMHPARPAPGVLAVLRGGDRVATREVAEATGTSVEDAVDALAALEREGLVERERHVTGHTWREVR